LEACSDEDWLCALCFDLDEDSLDLAGWARYCYAPFGLHVLLGQINNEY